MKCERCGKELSDADLYCDRCGQAVFPEYMDEADVWAYYKSDEELEQILKGEKEGKYQEQKKQPEQALKRRGSGADAKKKKKQRRQLLKKKRKMGLWKQTAMRAPKSL